MRVKLIIALAIASIFLLAGALPAGAVIGVTGPSGTTINIPTPALVPNVGPVSVVPCISFQAPVAPGTTPCLANTITLGGPAIQAAITLSGPQIPSFTPPSFILQQLSPPSITPFICTSPVFDP